jgi:mRNA-degrading endonuclease toxin of MazEF toxin-antitoxin module
VITCDNIVTLPIGMLASSRVGHLSLARRAELDHALRYALDIQY